MIVQGSSWVACEKLLSTEIVIAQDKKGPKEPPIVTMVQKNKKLKIHSIPYPYLPIP
jgi:hypothetical protein